MPAHFEKLTQRVARGKNEGRRQEAERSTSRPLLRIRRTLDNVRLILVFLLTGLEAEQRVTVCRLMNPRVRG
jgi:hypothetical protein